MRTFRAAVPTILVVATVLSACARDEPAIPDGVLEQLPPLAQATERHDERMRLFLNDLEAWARRSGQPYSAEALVGSLFLSPPRMHSPEVPSDTGLDAEYQRLEVRFAELLKERDSLRRETAQMRDTVLQHMRASGDSLFTMEKRFRTSVLPPPPADSQRYAASQRAPCPIFDVILTDADVRICVLSGQSCIREQPGLPWWSRVCAYSCIALPRIRWPFGASLSVSGY